MKGSEVYTDIDIVSRIVEGNIALYEIIIRRYNPYLYKTGRAYGFSHHDTEDLMQETYISAYAGLGKFQHRSSVKTWIVKIMLHHCYQKKQKFSFQKEKPSDSDVNEKTIPMFSHLRAHTGSDIINKELGHVLENALQRLPDDYRIVFALRELNGLSIIETAGALEISESNVKVRLNRAKNMLRIAIEKMYSTEDIFEFNLVYCDNMVEKVMGVINAK